MPRHVKAWRDHATFDQAKNNVCCCFNSVGLSTLEPTGNITNTMTKQRYPNMHNIKSVDIDHHTCNINSLNLLKTETSSAYEEKTLRPNRIVPTYQNTHTGSNESIFSNSTKSQIYQSKIDNKKCENCIKQLLKSDPMKIKLENSSNNTSDNDNDNDDYDESGGTVLTATDYETFFSQNNVDYNKEFRYWETSKNCPSSIEINQETPIIHRPPGLFPSKKNVDELSHDPREALVNYSISLLRYIKTSNISLHAILPCLTQLAAIVAHYHENSFNHNNNSLIYNYNNIYNNDNIPWIHKENRRNSQYLDKTEVFDQFFLNPDTNGFPSSFFFHPTNFEEPTLEQQKNYEKVDYFNKFFSPLDTNTDTVPFEKDSSQISLTNHEQTSVELAISIGESVIQSSEVLEQLDHNNGPAIQESNEKISDSICEKSTSTTLRQRKKIRKRGKLAAKKKEAEALASTLETLEFKEIVKVLSDDESVTVINDKDNNSLITNVEKKICEFSNKVNNPVTLTGDEKAKCVEQVSKSELISTLVKDDTKHTHITTKKPPNNSQIKNNLSDTNTTTLRYMEETLLSNHYNSNSPVKRFMSVCQKLISDIDKNNCEKARENLLALASSLNEAAARTVKTEKSYNEEINIDKKKKTIIPYNLSLDLQLDYLNKKNDYKTSTSVLTATRITSSSSLNSSASENHIPDEL